MITTRGWVVAVVVGIVALALLEQLVATLAGSWAAFAVGLAIVGVTLVVIDHRG